MIAHRKSKFANLFVPFVIFAAISISGCTGNGPVDRGDLPSTASTVGTPEPDRPCAVVIDPPNLPVQDLNLKLPVRDVRSEYIQREIQLTRDRGVCNSTPPPQVANECAPVYGAEDELEKVILWRSADLVSEYLFANGASNIVSESVTGHAGDDGVFRYRAVVIEHEREDLAEGSPIWHMLDACDPRASGTEQRILYDAEDAYLVATKRDTRIIVVETWTGTYKGRAGRIADTSSGRLPTSAVNSIVEWIDRTTSRQSVES